MLENLLNNDFVQNNVNNSGNNIINILIDMGFDIQLVTTICNNIHPIDVQEALDYLNENDQGLFTHSYIPNERFVCSICGKGRGAHQNEAHFLEENNNNEDFDLFIDNEIDNNINILDININNMFSQRRYRLESFYQNSKLNKFEDYNTTKTCGICEEKIEYPETEKIRIKCNHSFCSDCWLNYLKEKINNANVAKISCMQSGCGVILDSTFIKKILEDNLDLIKKYEKFLERQKILQSDKKYKFCPIPDCDGYAERKDKDKYVKCNFGHEFCFNCLSKPHGNRKCSEILDTEFEKWKSHKIVKRCPKCKIWTEKNEGCNHMTCVECKFQWCWLCQKEYKPNHYIQGSCRGLQFEREEDEEKIKKLMEENLKNPNARLNYLNVDDLFLNNNAFRNGHYNIYRDRNIECCIKCNVSIATCLLNLYRFVLTFFFYLAYYIAKEGFYILRFVFLLPYTFMFYNLFKYCKKDFLFYIFILLLVPFFICFGILTLGISCAICLPSVYNTYYRNYLKRYYTKLINDIPFTLITIENEENEV